MNGWNREEIHHERSLADVAEHEARHRREETPGWWLAVVWLLISLSAAIMIIALAQVWKLLIKVVG